MEVAFTILGFVLGLVFRSNFTTRRERRRLADLDQRMHQIEKALRVAELDHGQRA